MLSAHLLVRVRHFDFDIPTPTIVSDIVSALLECSGTVVQYVQLRLTILDAVTGTYWAVITLDVLPKAKVAIVWESVSNSFHAKSKNVLR